MDPAEILAVEIKQYVGKGLKTLVPRVMGQTAEAQKKKATSRAPSIQWDESSFFKELETRHGAGIAQTARQILEWARKSVTRIYWGEGEKYGGFVPILMHDGRKHQLFSVQISGLIRLYLYWYTNKAPFDLDEKRLELLSQLNSIPGVSIPKDAISGKPKIDLSILKDRSKLNQFLETFEWVIQEIKAS
jgi:hypothetical protein